MASDVDALVLLPQDEAHLYEILLHDYLHLLAISCLFYDYCLTFAREYHYLWRRPNGRSAYWFFLNRYFAFFGNLAVTVIAFGAMKPEVCYGITQPVNMLTLTSNRSCRSFNSFRQALLVISQIIVCVILTLRTYALFGCSLRILACMIVIGVSLAGITCWSLLGQHSSPSIQVNGCHLALTEGTAKRLAIAWGALFAYDAMIFALTFYKTWIVSRQDRVTPGQHVPIIVILLRDGTIYFAVMALANLSNIITFYICGPYMRGGLSTLASSISVTMMSRLMLNLHGVASTGIYTTQVGTQLQYSPGGDNTANVELDSLWSGALESQSVATVTQVLTSLEGSKC